MSGRAAQRVPPARLLLAELDRSLPGVAAVIRALRHAAAAPVLLLTWPTDPDRQAALEIAPPHQGQNHTPGADPPWMPS